MYVVALDTGQFWQADGTKHVEWANPNSTYTITVHQTMLWGGMSIGANMDFAAALYLTGPEHNLHRVWPGGVTDSPTLLPLEILSLDRYGESNGQNYQHTSTWAGMTLQPGYRLILQANCVQHGVGANPVMGTPYANDNAHAQAYIWMT